MSFLTRLSTCISGIVESSQVSPICSDFLTVPRLSHGLGLSTLWCMWVSLALYQSIYSGQSLVTDTLSCSCGDSCIVLGATKPPCLLGSSRKCFHFALTVL
jgi:hypothetical protein